MRNPILFLCLTILFSLNIQAQDANDSSYVVIKGEVHDYEYEQDGKTFPVNHEEIHVTDKYGLVSSLASSTINDNQVEFTFYYDEFKQYNITPFLGSSFTLLSFYPDADTIFFSIKSPEEMVVKGGDLTNDYFTRLSRIYESHKDDIKKIEEKYGTYSISFEDGQEVIDNHIAKEKFDSLNQDLIKVTLASISDNPTLSDYNLFLDQIISPRILLGIEFSVIKDKADFLRANISNPIYDSISTSMMRNVSGNFNIREGKEYVNISATDLNDDLIELRDAIGGK